MKNATRFKVFVFVISVFISFVAQAQIPEDLSKIKAEQITDDQLKKFADQSLKSGMSETAILGEIKKRGLPDAEVTKLQERMKQMNTGTKKTTATIEGEDAPVRDKLPETEGPEVVAPSWEPKPFGAELFSNSKIKFEPNLRIPTPTNYKLGPDDQLIIDVYGVNEKQQKATVGPEGSIRLDYIGQVFVNGLTIEEATARLKIKYSKIYPGINSGASKLSVSLGNIRSIKITILGSVQKPGTYTLPSLATVFNALYASGGPNNYGSFREIELIRNSKLVEKIDIYKFLLQGNQQQNLRLEDNDLLLIPTAKTQVKVKGEIKRNAIFEMLPGESLGTLINVFAAGFQSEAFTANISVDRITDRQKKLIDVAKKDMDAFIPADGDMFTIGKIVDRYENAVTISGSVFRPGKFAFQQGMNVSDLIERADGFLEDVYKDRALLYRLKEDKTKEILAINLNKELDKNILLRKDDSLSVSSISDLKEVKMITINGSVRKPSSFEFLEGLKVKDVVMMAGGFSEEASLLNFEIARRKKSVDPNDKNAALSDILLVTLDTLSLTMQDAEIAIQPFDIISVKKDPFKRNQEFVTVTGKVFLPGSYTLLSRSESISTIIQRAGGILSEGNINGAILRREKEKEKEKEKENITKIAIQAKDSTGNLEAQLEKNYFEIAIDLKAALANPGSAADVTVRNGDELIIPLKDPLVSVEGEVLHPVRLTHKSSKSLRFYISSAGGYLSSANRKKIFIVNPNGSAARTKMVLGIFRMYPQVIEGSKIFVPKKPINESPKRTAAETAAVLGTLGTVVSAIALILSQIKF
ncbi:MAG: hypothetical protein EPO57_01265 [Chitinophagaceae bacterium]|nr:MAG: hypothetical protein EPO57_01265 [Chitinophagaceae bacterium]